IGWCFAGSACPKRRLVLGVLVAGAMSWSVTSSLRTYPHNLVYFNEWAGGSENGYRHMLGSSLDWEQDAWFLKDWVNEHPHARPLFVDTTVRHELDVYGIVSEGIKRIEENQ